MVNIDDWVNYCHVRAFNWIDGKHIYIHLENFRPGASIEQPPECERSFLIDNDDEDVLRMRFDSVIHGLLDKMYDMDGYKIGKNRKRSRE